MRDQVEDTEGLTRGKPSGQADGRAQDVAGRAAAVLAVLADRVLVRVLLPVQQPSAPARCDDLQGDTAAALVPSTSTAYTQANTVQLCMPMSILCPFALLLQCVQRDSAGLRWQLRLPGCDPPHRLMAGRRRLWFPCRQASPWSSA